MHAFHWELFRSITLKVSNAGLPPCGSPIKGSRDACHRFFFDSNSVRFAWAQLSSRRRLFNCYFTLSVKPLYALNNRRKVSNFITVCVAACSAFIICTCRSTIFKEALSTLSNGPFLYMFSINNFSLCLSKTFSAWCSLVFFWMVLSYLPVARLLFSSSCNWMKHSVSLYTYLENQRGQKLFWM